MKCPQCGMENRHHSTLFKPGGIFRCGSKGPNQCYIIDEFFKERGTKRMTEAERDPLLQEREKTHGSFANNAAMYDRLYTDIGFCKEMVPAQRLALNMILLKISRAVEMPHVKDHWDDIAGYAKLAAEACK